MRIRAIEHCVLGGEEVEALEGHAAVSAEAESVATVQAEAVVSVKLGVLKGLIKDTISEAEEPLCMRIQKNVCAKVDASWRPPPASPCLPHPFRNLVEYPDVLPLVLEHMAGVGLVAVVDGASPTGTRADDVVFSFPKALRLG